jgi:hypothetical protein
MNQTYVLRNPEIAKRMVDFIKATAGTANAAGRPLMVTVTEYRARRSNEANARYWALLGEIAEQVQVNGKYFSNDTWHEHFKSLFAPKEDGPSGPIPISTSHMNTEQFSHYMTRVEVYAAQQLGVEFAAV